MAIEITRGTNRKPVASDELVKLLQGRDDLSGQLFVGYPIVNTPDGPLTIDALLVSPTQGVISIDLVEGTQLGDFRNRQDNFINMLDSKLKLHRELVSRRKLLIELHAITFAPGIGHPQTKGDSEYPVTNNDTLLDGIKQLNWANSEASVYNSTLSALQGIRAIRKPRSARTLNKEDSRGSRLGKLEDSIATLDNPQSKAVIETVEGVQRIRGLAGSGKTIVLALKAAYLHAQHPEWRIAVTFNSRSLKGQFRRLIHNFSLQQTGQEPDWDTLRILSAWGAPGSTERDGLYYEFCRVNGLQRMDLRSARALPNIGTPFQKACEQALQEAPTAAPVYDAILVDEAQDLAPAFLQLCFAMLRDPKRLVYAYDELQNLTEESLPSVEDLFGPSANVATGLHENDRDASDIILERCYRNSRPLLVTAHALGFGIYRKPPPGTRTGLIQMFDNPSLWKDVGYQVATGSLIDNQQVVLQRTKETSPLFLEEHSPIEDLIKFVAFDTAEEQDRWVSEEIRRNLLDEELRHDDIIVINPDPLTTRENVGSIRNQLLQMDIQSHLAGIDTDPDVFFKEQHASVTFTGINRAKGNEAGMVYVINAQDRPVSNRNLASMRNRLFTAITRSKAWIRVVGVGDRMNELVQEYERLKDHQFALEFLYPDANTREELRIVHRDLSEGDRNAVEGHQSDMRKLLTALELGNVRPEDLDRDLSEQLKKHLY